MAPPRHGCRSEQPTADNAPCTVEPQAPNQEWGANRAHNSERSLRNKSWLYRCIRLIKIGLGQVNWYYSGSTKDSCHEEQNENPTVPLHGHPRPKSCKITPADIGCQTARSESRVVETSALS